MNVKATPSTRSEIKLAIDSINYVLVSFRLPFTGSPFPSDFCVTTYIVPETINDLLENEDWEKKRIQPDF